MCRQRFWSILVGVFFCWSWSVVLQAMPKDSLVQQAQQALILQQSGQTEAAVLLYERIIAQGYQSDKLYNNLGLAYAKQGLLGQAILQWERALRQAPLNKDAQHNLKTAQQYIKRPIVMMQSISFVRYWRSLHQQWTAKGWGILFLIFWSLTIASVAYAWNNDAIVWRNHIGIKLAVVLLVLGLLPLGLSWAQQAQEQEHGTAIIIANQAGLRPNPALSSQEMEVLSEGVRVQVVEEQGEWVKVELPNYLLGWIPKSLLEQV